MEGSQLSKTLDKIKVLDWQRCKYSTYGHTDTAYIHTGSVWSQKAGIAT